MPQGSNFNSTGEQSGGPIPRLQRAVHVRDGAGVHAVPARVHVPGHPAAAQLYELCGTTAVGTHTLPYRDTCHVSYV